ncbi:hypothetical protein K3N28_06355 [Glycomyces sp. TRM65418]|uniref:hypothetical protein n=1 Tax=Glycomyces sp. TRM65418 TaxID=2867006 RepID=UPI001CE5763B|nr:hypothetical protein [Glycomyces sp. TRM65418]MCC3762690.1 hypothetical protein [Glycomyces sp. TRM65418]QZD56725.1 hypothetical protein K3N28_06305 [Glycomyces sp. TRM65418]
MDPYAFLAIQFVNSEARSALPDAPVVPDRPTLLSRIAGGITAVRGGFIARDLRASSGAALPKRADVRRAA